MSLRVESDRLKTRIEEIDRQLAQLAAREARLREERQQLVSDRQQIRAYLDANPGGRQ